MKVALPLHQDPKIRQMAGSVESAFERVNEYAVVPAGGAAGSVLVKSTARSYVTAWQSPADTAANIASAAAAINTTGKFQGRQVYDTTNHRIMVADGVSPTSLWYRADGALSVTPT